MIDIESLIGTVTNITLYLRSLIHTENCYCLCSLFLCEIFNVMICDEEKGHSFPCIHARIWTHPYIVALLAGRNIDSFVERDWFRARGLRLMALRKFLSTATERFELQENEGK